MPVPSEEERQPGVNSFAESVMFCVINRRPACAARVTVLGLCVCLSTDSGSVEHWQFYD